VGARVDLVAVAASFVRHDVAVGHEVGDDLLGCAFADADLVGDLAGPDPGIARDAEENVPVVAEEGLVAAAVSLCCGLIGAL
jgi:hypothetical protein